MFKFHQFFLILLDNYYKKSLSLLETLKLQVNTNDSSLEALNLQVLIWPTDN